MTVKMLNTTDTNSHVQPTYKIVYFSTTVVVGVRHCIAMKVHFISTYWTLFTWGIWNRF